MTGGQTEKVYTRAEAVRSNILHVSAGLSLLPARTESDFIRDGLPVCHGEAEISAQAAGAGLWRFAAGERLLVSEASRALVPEQVYVMSTGGEAPVVDRVKTVDGERNFVRNLRQVPDHMACRAELCFAFREGERLFGLGQGEDGLLNKRGRTTWLYQHNMRIPMPCLVSDQGYGLLFNCGGLMCFDDARGEGKLVLDCVPYLDYYLIYGPAADRIVEGFRFLTGRAQLLPRWAFGYLQSKEQYYSAGELEEVGAEYRRRGIPIDGVVQDWNSWSPGQWGEKRLDPARYADMEERAAALHAMHVHTMVSVWPNMNSTTADYRELAEASKILNDLATYNAFDEEARAIYWRQARQGLFDRGFDAWWCDSTEPFSGPDWNGEKRRAEEERFALVGGEHVRYLPREKASLFALYHARGIYENQRKHTQAKRVLNLTRSGYLAGQQYGALLWSGDISATWETMRAQIAEGLSVGLSGYPWWTLDAGAFFVVKRNWRARGCGCSGDSSMKWFWNGAFENGMKDPAWREYYVRFLELACFLPVFRSHGTDVPREIWNFGEEGDPFYDAIAETIRLRYRLMPYIYSMAGAVRLSDFTMMRSLLFDYAADPRAGAVDDEFMFGRGLLVCPVTEPMYYDAAPMAEDGQEPAPVPLTGRARTRECYLPAGPAGSGGEEALWYDYRTDERCTGGQTVTAAAPLHYIPLFVPAGTILPEKEGLQYADDGADAALELHLYPGRNGSFTLYEDEGDGYRFENGAFAQVDLCWQDAERRLLIGARRGAYPGMPEAQRIRLYLGRQFVKELVYNGNPVETYVTESMEPRQDGI